MLEEALEPIREALAEGREPTSIVLGAEGPLTRGQFFMHLMTGLCIHRGEAAFNEQFLATVRNNADDFYEAYSQISRGTHSVETTTRQLLEDAQQRLRAVEHEKQTLADRARELEDERVALLASTAAEESVA